MGYGILAGSTLVKVPQLLNVVRAGSAEGLNPLSIELESLGLSIGTLYGFMNGLPFSAFGEVVVSSCVRGRRQRARRLGVAHAAAGPLLGPLHPPLTPPTPFSTSVWAQCWPPLCAVPTCKVTPPCRAPTTPPPRPTHPPARSQALFLQNSVLLLLVYLYQRRSLARTATLLALLAGLGFAALSGALTAAQVTRLYEVNNLLLVASRLPQILQNARAGATGQLSLITYSLNSAGAAARIFTSIQENAGPAMLRGAIISESRVLGFRVGLPRG